MRFILARVLFLAERKRHLAAKKGFDPWTRRFGTTFDDETSVRRLDDSIIKFLIPGGEDSAAALYELVMGMQGLGAGSRFHSLDSENKMGIMDVTLFLLDLTRFEAMRRLGWLDDYPYLNIPLIDLVQGFRTQFASARNQCPPLSSAHPQYLQYSTEFEGDRNAFVRKLIPEAIQTFCRGKGGAGNS